MGVRFMKIWMKIFRKESRKLLKIFHRPTFIYLTVVGNVFLLVSTLVVYHLEKGSPQAQFKSYFDALWWGISTITTVGYGDILPQTFLGRLIDFVLMYSGTVLFISFTGVLLSELLKEEVEEEIVPLEREMRLEERSQAKIESLLEVILARLERIERELKES